VAKSRAKAEYGDFQTPLWLAEQICAHLKKLGAAPATIVEPTCGTGAFLLAAARTFNQVANLLGVEVNPAYVNTTFAALQSETRKTDTLEVEVRCDNFFTVEWREKLAGLPVPLLILGNPPWVTNTELATLDSANQPPKSNFQQRAGIDAITGASNFDVSEWMILKLLEATDPAKTTLSMLCKTAVARKVLLHSWQQGWELGECRLYQINAQQAFGAAIDACLLYIGANTQNHSSRTCAVYASLDSRAPTSQFAFCDANLVANVQKYERWLHLATTDQSRTLPTWRSGIKHDCSPVMELLRCAQGYQNKLGELVKLEDDLLFPLYKASDLMNNCQQRPDRWLIITQLYVGADTHPIHQQAPLTWHYLDRHHSLLDRRRSTIYSGQPRFAIFGVGDYSFAPWKVAISGMHKSLQFVVLGPVENKPAVLDDTCYFLPCTTQRAAVFLAELLNSDVAREFFEAFIFWNDKRPITAKLLRRLNIALLAYELGREREFSEICSAYGGPPAQSNAEQLRLLEKRAEKLC